MSVDMTKILSKRS